MAKAKIPAPEKLSADTQEFFDVLNEKSDFAVILIAAAYLDAAVAGVLRRSFCDQEITNFDDQSIRDLVDTLVYLTVLPISLGAETTTVRSKFVLTAVMLSQRLVLTALGAKRFPAMNKG